MNKKTATRVLAAFALCAASTPALALGDYTETFSVDAAAWRITDSVTTMTWFSAGGPAGAGDAYASVTNMNFTGVADGAFRLAVRGHDGYDSSGDAFVGNWLTSGVFMFSMDVRHDLGVPARIGFRLASSANNPGASIVPEAMVPSGEWRKLVVPISPNLAGFNVLNYGSGNFTNVFSSIGNIQVLVYAPVGYGGAAGPYKLDIDNPSIQLSGAPAELASTNTPSYDRWMYPFSASSPLGNRPTASTFGTLDPDFDQRDAQVYFGFALTNAIPAGLGPDSYDVVSCRLEVTMSGGATHYDPTQDPWQSYLDPTQALHVADADLGRPMELFGAGWRNGYTPWTYGEDGPYAAGFGVYKNVRNVHALGFVDGVGVDVSNSVDPDGTATNGFDPVVFAIGTAALPPGEEIPLPTTFAFDVDAANPLIQGYLRESLNDGILGLVLATLHQTAFEGPSNFPVWDQKESIVGTPATLAIEYRIKPELGLAMDGAVMTARWALDATRVVVEEADSLVDPVWRPLTIVVSTNETAQEAVVPNGNASGFLRLRQP
ncbi:MAG TPA: hypothetical protein PKE12_08170 [Kiritimatiellia bacterium]|nr:hypothetical protein [Kiritimatiellia bacterium]